MKKATISVAVAVSAAAIALFIIRHRRKQDVENRRKHKKEMRRKAKERAKTALDKKITIGNTIKVFQSTDPGISLIGSSLDGEDQFTGAAVGCDGNLYAVPGSSNQVIRIDPRTMAVTALPTECRGTKFGSELKKGRFKWLRGITAADANTTGSDAAIYGIPCNAHAVLKILPKTGEVTTMTHWTDPKTGKRRANPVLRGSFKWHGGVLSKVDGNIYCVPASSTRVLMIVPRTGEVRLVGPELLPELGDGTKKTPLDLGGRWYGGLLGIDNGIYGMPCNANCVLRIMPQARKAGSSLDEPDPDPAVTTMDAPLELGNWDYHGGVVSRGGREIFAVPMHAKRVLSISPETGVVRFVGEAMRYPERQIAPSERPRWVRNTWSDWKPDRYQFGGGVLAPDEKTVYLLPYDAPRVVRISPAEADDGEAKVSVLDVARQSETDMVWPNKWQNGFVGKNGLIYGIPVSGPAVLRIDPSSDVVDTVGHDACRAAGKYEKWEGAAVSPFDGALYCVPQCANAIMRIGL
mmetsp:Transcript_42510/g.85962  ORF Transcript_42510/g.85962 Transcript_42510/m.85962 type:complete len:520 (-) Transcript_42510:92-1651(-)